MLRRYLAGPTLIRDTARAPAQACDDARMAQVPSAVAQAAGAFGLDAGSLRALGGNSGSAWGAGNRVLRVGRPAVTDARAGCIVGGCGAADARRPGPGRGR